jgi:small subunit ribosomal protein S6
MTQDTTQLYEGMFLFNIQAINNDLQSAIDHVTEILTRAEAQIVAITRYDERRLAYEIKGQKRGLYLLAYFNVRPSQVANIERDVNLSELLLRCLIIRGEHLGETEMQQVRQDAAKLADHAAVKSDADRDAPADDNAQAPAKNIAANTSQDG